MRVLLIEDEWEFARGLQRRFGQEGVTVDIAGDGETGLARAKAGGYDLVLLDIMLPRMGGIELCRRLRQDSDVPVIMLTARDDYTDKIIGLELGADDYLTKPFNFRELQARIRAVMRRVQGTAGPGGEEQRRVGGLHLDRARRLVHRDGRPVELTAREFELLWLLAGHPQRVFTREQLLEKVWGFDYFGHTRAVDVQLRRLRQKIEPDPAHPRYLHTRWGVGYYLGDGEERE